jgi:hypothetical protein
MFVSVIETGTAVQKPFHQAFAGRASVIAIVNSPGAEKQARRADMFIVKRVSRILSSRGAAQNMSPLTGLWSFLFVYYTINMPLLAELNSKRISSGACPP